jgi:hypothetical protein
MKSQYKSGYAKKRAQKKRVARKPVVKKTTRTARTTVKRGVVKPTRVVARPGYMSQSAWIMASRPEKISKRMEEVGALNTYTTNGARDQQGMGGCYSIGSINHLNNSALNALIGTFQGIEVNNIGPRRIALNR